jgi:hypothetical protein
LLVADSAHHRGINNTQRHLRYFPEYDRESKIERFSCLWEKHLFKKFLKMAGEGKKIEGLGLRCGF